MKTIMITITLIALMVALPLCSEAGEKAHSDHKHHGAKVPAAMPDTAHRPVTSKLVKTHHHQDTKVAATAPDTPHLHAVLKSAKTPQTVCPVMGGKIDRNYSTEYDGKRVYFCCPGCIEPFKKDPEKHIKKIAGSKVVLESIQKVCPVSGKQINRNIYTDYKGRRIYFCCPDCVKKFKKGPGKYLNKLNLKSTEKAK